MAVSHLLNCLKRAVRNLSLEYSLRDCDSLPWEPKDKDSWKRLEGGSLQLVYSWRAFGGTPFLLFSYCFPGFSKYFIAIQLSYLEAWQMCVLEQILATTIRRCTIWCQSCVSADIRRADVTHVGAVACKSLFTTSLHVYVPDCYAIKIEIQVNMLWGHHSMWHRAGKYRHFDLLNPWSWMGRGISLRPCQLPESLFR